MSLRALDETDQISIGTTYRMLTKWIGIERVHSDLRSISVIGEDNMNRLIASRTQDMPSSSIMVISERAQQMEDVVRMELGEPDFDTPEHIRRAAAQAMEEGRTHYTLGAGISELREEISRKLRVDNSLEYDPKTQVVVTAGSTTALNLALLTTVNPGEEVLVPSPGWAQYVGCVKFAQAIPVYYSLTEKNRFGLDSEELRQKVTKKTKAILICSPNNPTGSVLTEKELRELSSFAEEHDLLVISDEVYEKITYEGAKHRSIGSIDGMAKRVITVNAFSKTYAMTGWRLGYAAGPSEISSQMVKLNILLNTCASSIAQRAGVQALRGSQDCVQEMCKEYSRRRAFVLERIDRIPNMTCVAPRGAFYVFPNITEFGLSSFDFVMTLLEKARVSTIPGNAFGPSGEGYFRISYASSMENLARGMDRIEAAIETGLKTIKS